MYYDYKYFSKDGNFQALAEDVKMLDGKVVKMWVVRDMKDNLVDMVYFATDLAVYNFRKAE